MYCLKKIIPAVFIFLIISCESQSNQKVNSEDTQKDINLQQKSYNVTVLRKFPHDSLSFIQGLTYYKGFLYETSGQQGQSSILKVDVKTGKVLQTHRISSKYFGEGSTIFKDKLYYFTWKDQVGWTFDLQTFKQTSIFCYDSEGWGITNNGENIIISDGTNLLRYKDENNFNTLKTKEVFYKGEAFNFLNELEYAKGDIYANIWGKDLIAVIDEESGEIKALINLAFLRNELDGSTLAEVLNGVAYIPESDTFIITGKNWPYYFEIKID